MKETLFRPPTSQEFEVSPRLGSVGQGACLGATAGAVLSVLYAASGPLYLFLGMEDNAGLPSLETDGVVAFARNTGMFVPIMGAFWFVITLAATIVGGPLGTFGGMFGGMLLGIPFRNGERLALREALAIGALRALVVTSLWLTCTFAVLERLGVDGRQDILLKIPGVLAFFGFWWVTLEVNRRMPIKDVAALDHTVPELPVGKSDERPVSLLQRGAELGARTGAALAVVYSGGAMVWLGVQLVGVAFVGDYGIIFLFGLAAFLTSALVSVSVGVVGGGLLGWLFRCSQVPYSTMSAPAVGIALGIAILLIPNLFVARGLVEEAGVAGIQWSTPLFPWYLPNLAALYVQVWVTYRLNQSVGRPFHP